MNDSNKNYDKLLDDQLYLMIYNFYLGSGYTDFFIFHNLMVNYVKLHNYSGLKKLIDYISKEMYLLVGLSKIEVEELIIKYYLNYI